MFLNFHKIKIKDIDQLNAVLTVTIGREDYEPKFNQELKKMKDKANMRGFRPGKTPTSFLKKMYGKSLLSEIVTEMLQAEMNKVMSEDKESHYLGQPIPSTDFKRVEFRPNELEDYTFSFSLGKAPEFEVQGVDSSTEFEFFVVPVPEEKVDEQLMLYRKSKGENAEVQDIQDGDIITFNAVEMDNDAPLDEGWKTTFTIAIDRISDENLKQELLGKKPGDTVQFNIYELEKDADRNFVKKYFLNLTESDIEEGTETGEMYQATIEKVQRRTPAELNEEFFTKVFGEEVKTEEQARDILRKSLGGEERSKSESLLYRDIRKHLIELNREATPLPEDFLKRWMELAHPEEAEKIAQDFEGFTEDMRWDLIKNKLNKRFDIQVTEQEIIDLAFDRIAGYFGGYYDPKFIEPMLERFLKDEKNVMRIANELAADKLFQALKNELTIREVPVSKEELNEKFELARKEEAKNEELAEEAVHAEIPVEVETLVEAETPVESEE